MQDKLKCNFELLVLECMRNVHATLIFAPHTFIKHQPSD